MCIKNTTCTSNSCRNSKCHQFILCNINTYRLCRDTIIAAVVLTMLPEVLRGLADYRMLIYAIVLIIMMLFNWAPKAIEWREKHSFKRMFGKKEKAEEVQ